MVFQTVPYTPDLYNWVTYRNTHFLFTSYDGDVLQEYLEQEEAVGVEPECIIEAVVRAIYEAHQLGVHHTDIHPKNICIQGEEVTIIDWFDAYTTVPLNEPLFCTWCPPEVIDFVDETEEQTLEGLRRLVAYQIGKLIQALPENKYSKEGIGEAFTQEKAEDRLLVSEFVAEYL